MLLLRCLTALLFAAAASPALAIDEADLLPIDEAFALTATATERGRIEFHWRIADGYYLYRHRMGVQPVDGSFKFNPLELPPGEKKVDEFFGETETYRGSVKAVLTGAAASGVDAVEFTVRYQGCADAGICYPPHKKTLRVALPADAAPAAPAAANPLATALGNGHPLLPGSPPAAATDAAPLPPEQAFAFEAIATSPERLLLRFTPAPGYYVYRDRSAFELRAGDVTLGAPQWPQATPHTDDHFGEVAVYFEPVEVPLPLVRRSESAGRVTIAATFQGCQTDGICYPPMTREVSVDVPAGAITPAENDAAPRPAAGYNFFVVLLLALGGGLILNLMPCVLPVLSLKALSLAESGRSGGRARSSALWYTAGVLASFAAIGALAMTLRAAGLALGWGFQLQQPLVVAVLAYLMVAIGLSLSGVFQIGAGVAGVGQSLTEKSGAAGDFFTGVLAVVVASPCTAPLMGYALAYAFTAPTALAIGVFMLLGLGLALPFLLIGFVPALSAALPRPGAWMNTFKHAMAFPMYLTAAWLAWVLGNQRGVDAIGVLLAGAVALSAALWWREHRRDRTRIADLVVVALLAGGIGWSLHAIHGLPAPSREAAARDDAAVAYSAERLDALRRDRRVVFVNMTADWCVTCKVNEKNVLGGEEFRAAMTAANAVYMKGDWTNVDPEITRFLEQHGAVGVPLYVVFPASGDGIVLPTVLTQAIVADALQSAAR